MIVVDTSAVIAIFEWEDDAVGYAKAILEADELVMPAVNAHEAAIAQSKKVSLFQVRSGVPTTAHPYHTFWIAL